MRSLNSKNSGFSLIEVVFAMSFLTLIILGVLSLQSGNLAMINSQNNQIQAYFYTEQGIQILKSIGYSSICASKECELKLSDSSYSLEDKAGNGEVVGGIFSRYVEFADSDKLNQAYRATVFVKWDDSTGNHTVSAKTIIF